jgi:hypothetical protein
MSQVQPLAPDPVVTWAVQWIGPWLAAQGPAQLAAWAQAQTDLVPLVLGRFPLWMRRVALRHVPPEVRAALATAGPAQWAAVVDALCVRWPAVGVVAWQHEAWFHRQLAAARDAFLHPQ